jgi:hypothetical protein
MKIIGIDPGTRPGFALLADGRVVYAGRKAPPGVEVDVVAVERPVPNPKAHRDRVISQGITVGALAMLVPAAERCIVPVAAWRGQLWPGSKGQESKTIVLERLRTLWHELVGGTPPESPDVLEAFGLAVAVHRMPVDKRRALRRI